MTGRELTTPGAADGTGPLRLDYLLEGLPSAQHRAGLAGLVLLARWCPLPGQFEVMEVTGAGASFLLTWTGLAHLFEAVHSAPEAAFPASLEPGGAGLWTRLWQDWLWTIHLRTPKAREPFEPGRPDRDAEEVWHALTQDGDPGADLDAGTLLGGYALSFDLVAVRERASQRFLLQFWPHAIMVYLLRRHRSWGGKPDLEGFVAAIPDVHDLLAFCAAFAPAMLLRSRERLGPRPREAVVDHPAEAALDFARRLQGAGAPPGLAVEAHHARIQGKSLRVQAVLRLQPGASLLRAYGQFRGLGYSDPGFRRIGIQSLLDGEPWHRGFLELFDQAGCLHRTLDSEPFRRDARMAFRVAVRGWGAGSARPLEATIRATVTSFVQRSVQARYQLRLEEVEGQPAAFREFQDKRREVASAAFRAARERSGRGFVEFFRAAILPGADPLAQEQALCLHQSLVRDPAGVRALTLLALAAVA